MKLSFLRHPLIALPVVFALGAWAGAHFSSPKTNGAPLPANLGGIAAQDRATGTGGPGEKEGTAKQVRIPALDLRGLSAAEAKRFLEGTADRASREAAIRQCLAGMPRDQWKSWMNDVFGFRKLATTDFADVAGMAKQYGRMDEIMGCIVAVDPVGFMAAQNSKGERNSDSENETRVMVMLQWAGKSPAAAKAFLAEQLASGRAAAGLSDSAYFMAGVMARHGEPGVLEWAATLPDKERAQATGAALTEMARTAPRNTAKRLEELKDLPELDPENLARKIAQTWSQENHSEALTWAAALDGPMRNNALKGVLDDWAAKDFEAALGAVRRLPPEASAAGLTTLIGKAPPERAGDLAALVEKQPAGPARAEASAAMMAMWTHQNPEAASLWMQRQPVGDIRDSAIASFVRWADVRDPEAALLWAGSMSDAGKRMDAIGHIIQQLSSRAPAAVQPWLETNTTLTETERTQILQKMNQPR